MGAVTPRKEKEMESFSVFIYTIYPTLSVLLWIIDFWRKPTAVESFKFAVLLMVVLLSGVIYDLRMTRLKPEVKICHPLSNVFYTNVGTPIPDKDGKTISCQTDTPTK